MRVLAWSSNLDPEAAREIGAEPVRARVVEWGLIA
jgi:hypothetical protein